MLQSSGSLAYLKLLEYRFFNECLKSPLFDPSNGELCYVTVSLLIERNITTMEKQSESKTSKLNHRFGT